MLSVIQQPIILSLFRGEKNSSWPPPAERLIRGLTLRRDPSGIATLWVTLQSNISKMPGSTLAMKLNAYSNHLIYNPTAESLSTAWTDTGAFTSDYNYKIIIRNAYLFHWAGTPGAPNIGVSAAYTHPEDVKDNFIVLNGTSVGNSTILGFGHKAGTREITFFTHLLNNPNMAITTR